MGKLLGVPTVSRALSPDQKMEDPCQTLHDPEDAPHQREPRQRKKSRRWWFTTFITSCLILITATVVMYALFYVIDQIKYRNKREVPLKEWYISKDPKTPFELNTWYNYAAFMANASNVTNCYVCSRLPLSASAPPITVRAKDISTLWPDSLVSMYADSLLHVVYTPYNKPFPKPKFTGRNYTKFLARNWTNPIILRTVPIPTKFKATCIANKMYVRQNYSVGEIALKHCSKVITPCAKLTNGSYNVSTAPPHATCVDLYAAPDVMGVCSQSDVYFLCGTSVFIALPMSWVGRCAVIDLTDQTYIVSAIKVTGKRQRRSPTDPHDPIAGSNVPDDHKLWSTGNKVLLSLFPQLGVGKIMLQVETMNYRMSHFINVTTAALESIGQELSALREMELQNRVVLDLLTASSGGVCAMVDTHCCTFIPDNTGDEGNVTKAIADLKALSKSIYADHTHTAWSLWSWFSSGNWWEVALKLLEPIIFVFITICLFICCIFPCVKKATSQLINTTMTNIFMNQEINVLLQEAP